MNCCDYDCKQGRDCPVRSTPLVQTNSDDTDPFYEPSDMAPMGPDEVGTWAIALALGIAFAMTLGAALVVRWLLS